MPSHLSSQNCSDLVDPLLSSCLQGFLIVNITCQAVTDLTGLCLEIAEYEEDSTTEGKYSSPMVLIGIYISVASLFCILAMALDLLYGLRTRKFWFPTKYFSLNATTITMIAVAMKLPVDLTSSMPDGVNQVAKVGGLGFMCTMMSNFMPSLASMDNKSLIANVTGLSILVITVIVNIFIQTRTHLIDPSDSGFVIIAYMYMGMLLFLLIILISSAITLSTTKKILEVKYQANSKRALNDHNPQQHKISSVEKLRQLVKRYWIMVKTGSPQYVMASNPLSSASGIICAICMLIHIFMFWKLVWWDFTGLESVYKWSAIIIVITQFIGTIVGSIAPIFRCFTILSFKSFSKQNRKHFLVLKVEKYWIQKLCEWKESRISFLSSGHRSRVLLHNLKNLILSICIRFQKAIVVSCKIIELIPIVVIIFVTYCSYYFKSVKAMLVTPTTVASSEDWNNDLNNYVLLLEDNMRFTKKTMKRISDSMNRFIQNVEKKRHNNLQKILEKSVAFDGVEAFDTDQVPSLLSVEHVNSWSLPIISLTCIAIAIPSINKDKVDNLLKSVDEGILYTHLVEESLNRETMYVNIRKATVTLWHDVQDNYKWLETTLRKSAYEGKMPTEIVKEFGHIAEEVLNEFKRSSSGEPVESENLPSNIIAANSMYRIAKTIMHTYERNKLEIIEEELFTRLCDMIADILAACLTNIPRVVEMRCHESVIEKREASVKAAIDLLGRTSRIIERLETRELPNMDLDKMGFIDEWRLHLKQP